MAPPLPPTPVGIRLNNASAPQLTVEMFHDVCCPFSKKMYDTIYGGVFGHFREHGLADRIDFVWQSVPQPWHAQSCLMHDAVMAAHLLDASKIADFLHAVFQRQTDFFDDATKDMTRIEIYRNLADIGGTCGYTTSAMHDLLNLEGVQGNGGLGDVTQNLKWAVKYHRGRGVHVTPTVFINGLEAGDISSGWTTEDWVTKLEPLLA